MPAMLPIEQQMTIEEFLAFTETRPQEERWELIEGRPVLNPSPTDWHQQIANTIGSALDQIQMEANATWAVVQGTGTRVPASPRSLPQPDVMVLETPVGAIATSVRDDAVVLFEILSRSNTGADQAWRRKVYASIPKLQHYVTIAQRRVEVVRYDRDAGWRGTKLSALDDDLTLSALGADAVIPLRRIYRRTPLAP